MYTIPKNEYAERIAKFQANLQAAGLDAALVHGNEADCANVRYLCDYWPTFEAAAVFVPAKGKPVLIIGPESEKYARGRSLIPDICLMIEYRESAEPNYPGIAVSHYPDVVAMSGCGPLRKLGIVSYSITPLPVLDGLKRDLPGVELGKADHLFVPMRFNKSANELACMRRAFAISELAVEAILNELKPGMTELQVIGIAQREIYKNGGEYEGHALYCFSGQRTNNAICRPTHKVIKANEIIQLNIGARVAGYSSSVGLPLSIGKLPAAEKRLAEFGLQAHIKTMELMQAGKAAAAVVKEYESWVKAQGFGQYLLYGPCHAIGMMEVEPPWMESTSTFNLAENMTFQVDTFFTCDTFGLRWENGVIVQKNGVEKMSSKFMRMIEL
ncbi:MAG: aminopeptidase P family protein [Lentisphaerae bacterium]|nr:aminopeptidase P family protein [Lentisphaerota bacterium]